MDGETYIDTSDVPVTCEECDWTGSLQACEVRQRQHDGGCNFHCPRCGALQAQTNKKVEAKEVYYFGYWRSSGHYLYDDRHVPQWKVLHKLPWEYSLDGGLCPKGEQVEGHARLVHEKGWTALAFWDRSGDHRSNSNSGIVAKGKLGFDEMVQLFKERFPEVWGRFTFELALKETDIDG